MHLTSTISAPFADDRAGLSVHDNVGGSGDFRNSDRQPSQANNGDTAPRAYSSGILQVPQLSVTEVQIDGSSGMNGTNGTNDINGADLPHHTRPRWDQLPLATSTAGGPTLTHVETTEYTESVYETVYEYDEDGNALLTHRKKKRKMASPSVYSYNSTRDISQFVKDVHGRTFNTLNDSYLLPSDESEWSRLDKQHIAQVLAMGGLTPCQDLVDIVLTPEEGVEKKVLDLGCGSGVWPIEMARKYPHTHVTGVDVAPVPFDPSVLPSNLTFEIDDINEGLEHFYNCYDVVHMRCVMIGLRDFDRTMREVQLCVKPGGLVIIIDGDINVCDKDRLHAVKIPDVRKEGPDSPGSWFRKIIWETDVANNLAGANPRRGGLLIDLGLWNHPLCDTDTVVGGEFFLPIGPWPKVRDLTQTQQLGYAGALLRQGILNVHRAYHPILLRHGMDQDTLDEWSRKIDQEIGEMKLRLWIRFRFTYARRREGPDLPAPPLPTPAPKAASTVVQGTQTHQPSGPEDSQLSPESPDPIQYPFITFFSTAEEAARNVERRREANPPYPDSDLEKAWTLKQITENPQVTTGQARE